MALDRVIGYPLAFAANVAARTLGFLLRRDHRITPGRASAIVVAKLVGMGSAIQATPLLRGLREAYPAARIVFVAARSSRGLIERLPAIDEIVEFDDSSLLRLAASAPGAILRLMRLRPELYLDLEVYSALASLISLASLARNRLGFYRHSVRFKKGTYTHLVYFNTRVAVRRLYFQLGRVAGVADAADESLGPLAVQPEEMRSAAEKLAGLGLPSGTPFVAFNANASDLLLERRWPLGHAREALRQLVARGYWVAMTGAPAEAPYVAELVAGLPPATRGRVLDTAGRLGLGELLGLLRLAACVVTNDSGPMHMAVALGRPTVGLFGPASPEHYGFEADRVVMLYAPVLCSPCVHEIDEPPCFGDNVCMQSIDPVTVTEAVEAMLTEPPGGSTPGARLLRLPVRGLGRRGTLAGVVARVSLATAAEGRKASPETDPTI